jgi:hypothetical protein
MRNPTNVMMFLQEVIFRVKKINYGLNKGDKRRLKHYRTLFRKLGRNVACFLICVQHVFGCVYSSLLSLS